MRSWQATNQHRESRWWHNRSAHMWDDAIDHRASVHVCYSCCWPLANQDSWIATHDHAAVGSRIAHTGRRKSSAHSLTPMGGVATGHGPTPAAPATPVARRTRYVSADSSGAHRTAASMTVPLTAWAVKNSPGVT